MAQRPRGESDRTESTRATPQNPCRPTAADDALGSFCGFCREILGHASDIPKDELLKRVVAEAARCSGCDSVLCWVQEGGWFLACSYSSVESQEKAFVVDYVRLPAFSSAHDEIVMARPLAEFFVDLRRGHVSLEQEIGVQRDMIWVPDTRRPCVATSKLDGKERRYDFGLSGRFGSAAMRLLKDDGCDIGFVVFARRDVDALQESDRELLALIGQILGMALENQAAQAQLRERIKELQCLYEVVHLGEQPDASIEQILAGVVHLLPPAWQYPEISAARITYDTFSFQTEGFSDEQERMVSNITIGDQKRGKIEVSYQEERPVLYEGPFLREERHLIDALAREVSGLIERRLAQEERARLEEQLRHADRLATIGQLGAGVAHELNEPLANILGFAQLAQKCDDLPHQAGKDLEKIERASLYAREVIKKLLIFSRQMPSSKAQVNLNQLVSEGASFFENRCAKEGIDIELNLESALPEINADPSQLYQVLINLMMNAVQAMPDGGRLMLSTAVSGEELLVVVEDTGIGMTDEVKKQLFVPFFTTKGLDEGTGLGLAVVHGIVSAHDGTISVESDVGYGTRMEVRLPLDGPAEASDAAASDTHE